MGDREWYGVETKTGRDLDPEYDIPNKEEALAFAREQAPNHEQPLVLVKFTRKEVRTFQRKVTVDEADVATAPPA